MNSRAGGGGTGDANAIQAVERAARILTAFTSGRPWLSLNELTERLGTSKPTAHRYTKALRAVGFLRYDEQKALYALGSQVLALASAARAGLPIIATAAPYMEKLVLDTNETVVLSIWDGSDSVVVVRSADNSNKPIRVSVRPGTRLPLTESAQGRIFCAFLDKADHPDLAKLINKDRQLSAELDEVRKRNFSVNSPPGHGIRTIAVPICQDKEVVAALAIVGTTDCIPESPDSPLGTALRGARNGLEAELGSSSD